MYFEWDCKLPPGKKLLEWFGYVEISNDQLIDLDLIKMLVRFTFDGLFDLCKVQGVLKFKLFGQIGSRTHLFESTKNSEIKNCCVNGW